MTHTLGSGLLAVVTLALLQGCGSGAATRADPPRPVHETSLADCQSAIPDTVVRKLGWHSASPATLDSGTCTREAHEGEIAVQRRAVPAVGGSDLRAAARKTFKQHCADLYGLPGTRIDWLGSGTPACARVAGAGPGLNVLVVVTDHDSLVESRISVDQDGASDHVQAGLVELARSASATF